ncbi:MAG: hypothetical protein ACOCXJ_07965, partial [Planctomycetota bacterium]
NHIHVQAGNSWLGHGRPQYLLWISSGGRGSARVADNDYAPTADAILATHSSSLQGIAAGDVGLQGWFCYYDGERSLLPLLPEHPEPELIRALCRHCQAAYRQNGADHRETGIWFEALLLALLEHNRNRPPLAHYDAVERAILSLCTAIDAEPQAEWTVAAMARRVGLSTSQLARRMRRLSGCAPQAYVLQARLALGRSPLPFQPAVPAAHRDLPPFLAGRSAGAPGRLESSAAEGVNGSLPSIRHGLAGGRRGQGDP